MTPPSGLSYSTNPATYTVGVAVAPNTPSHGGGAATSWSVSPTLPAGLTLDTGTGVVTGTPTAVTATATYVVTAANGGGSTSTSLSITVAAAVVPPDNLTYSANPATYAVGVAIAPNAPSSSGGAVASYSVLPALPAGLALDPSTGVITGTPTAVTAAADYVVTAANSGGSTSAILTLAVNDAPPSNLTYSADPATYTVGVAIAPNAPSSTGGAVVSYSVSPALPAGLALDPSTGVITGTPTAVTAAADYVVTAANVSGSTTATVTITVTATVVPPSNLTYSANPATYTVGVAIAPNTPSASGGAVESYSVSPDLPAGLALDPSTGVISGTPAAAAAAAGYTVTATNAGGSTSAVLTLTVKDLPPSNLGYSANPATYTVGIAIAANAPSSTGGAVVSYSVSPDLPAGLALDPSTGVIAGTPTAVTATASHVVTAANSGGSTSAILVIKVAAADAPPSDLRYATNPVTYGAGTAIVANTPSSGGGAVASYSVSPALPAGLDLDPSTGWITGTPTSVTPTAGYVVTAANPFGSTTATLTVTVAAHTVGTTGVVAAGHGHTCALVNGGVRCWGRNDHGQLGNGATTASGLPVAVSGLSSGVQAIAAGAAHACALVNGGVQCWGANGYGQLGDGSTTDRHVPVAVSGLSSGVQAIAAGAYFTCAIANGGVQCWGANLHGELGNGSATFEPVPAPVPVSGLSSGAQAIAAGDGHACALVNGGLQCWGYNGYGQLGNGSWTPDPVPTPVAVSGLASGVQAVAAGGYHTCALVSGGARCWGRNVYGQLGNGSTSDSLVPVPVSGLSVGAQAIAAGNSHACAVVNGGVRCWGRGSSGQLGNGSWADSQVPVASALSSGVQAVAAGGYHTCAVANGSIRCWGQNGYGQLGNDSTADGNTPVPVSGLSGGVQAIAAGDRHTCAVVSGGVQCWGDNLWGQFGNGSTTGSSVPVASNASSGVQAITAGAGHTCALVNGGVRCWGYNADGETGSNPATYGWVTSPVAVSGLSSGVQAIAAGDYHTCALVNGGVQCWGANGYGQLGNDSTTKSYVPVAVSGLSSGVRAITAGMRHTCALVNGGVWCWGSNQDGQLGSGNTNVSSRVPVAVYGLSSGAQAVAAGGYHTCAVVNGGVRCWGSNGSGQLGNDSTINRYAPVPVSGLTAGAQAVDGGTLCTCALVNGGVRCWGYNGYGQLGDGSLTASLVPVQVSGLSRGVQGLAPGGYHTCALADGGVRCWGTNSSGQLGNNSTTGSTVPVPVAASWP
ncbi:MAG TPA: putative Ig domain-containing protein [Anaeromyxobacter sp.]|nr:putative Ig domain-containing protein [Anaeromyxobacter sp.]